MKNPLLAGTAVQPQYLPAKRKLCIKRKAEPTVQTRQANDRMTEWRSSAMQSGWHLTRVSRRRSWTPRKAEGAVQRRMDWNEPIEIKETR